MAGNIKGITIEFNGDTTKLSKALENVEKQSKDLNSQLKQVNTSLKFNPGNAELIAQKQRILSEQIETTKKKLDTLKQAHKQAQKQLQSGKIGKEEFEALTREVLKTENQLKNFQKQAKGVKFPNLKATTAQLEEVGNKLKATGAKIKSVGSTLTRSLTLPLVAVGGYSAKMASDVNESTNKVEVAFGSAADEVKKFAKTTLDSYGIAKGTALDMASLFGDMATSMDIPQVKAAEMSKKLVGLAGDLSSFKNVSIDVAQNALKGIFTGETEALKGLGIVMNETLLAQYAMSKGYKENYKDLSQAEKVNLRYQFVLEKTKNAQGDFERTSDGAANSSRKLKESIKEVSGELGEALLPIITPIIEKLTELAKSFSNISPEGKNLIVTIGLIVAALGPIVGLIGGIITVLGLLLTPVGLVVGAITGLIAVGVALYANWEKMPEILSNIWNGIKVSALLIWGQFKQSLLDIWNAVTSSIILKASEIWSGIKGTFNSIKDTVLDVWNSVKAKTSEVWNNVKSSIEGPINRARDIVSNAINAIKNMFNFEFRWPKIKLPHFTIQGSMNPIKWLTEGTPKLGVNWYDKGGIFTSPQVIGVGEKRPEFVGALDDLRFLIGSELDKRKGGVVYNVTFNATVRSDDDIRRISQEFQRVANMEARR